MIVDKMLRYQQVINRLLTDLGGGVDGEVRLLGYWVVGGEGKWGK